MNKKIQNGIRIKPAPQNSVLTLHPYIMRVLEALEHPEAWVSDLSSVWDFSPTDEKENKKFIAMVSIRLGFCINEKDYIIDLAKRLKASSSDI